MAVSTVLGRSHTLQALGDGLRATSGFMPPARHGNWWWCLTFRQCRSTTPRIGEDAVAALLSSPISQHIYWAQKQKRETLARLQVAVGHGGKPWAECSYGLWGEAVLLLLLLYVSQSRTCSESHSDQEVLTGARRVSAFRVHPVSLAWSAEYFSWKMSLLCGWKGSR